MGKGRDKRKRHEDPTKAVKRATRQAQKRLKGHRKEDEEGEPEGFNNEEALEVTLNRIRKQESKTKTTREEDNVAPPSPRANIVFSVNPARDSELIIFGGEFWNGERTVAYNDLYFYHLKRSVWSRLVTSVNPSPRSSSQGVVYKHFLIVYGGEFVSQSQSQFLHFKDVWRFDARSFEWEEMKSLRGGPSSRSGHRMCLWRRSAVVFGGFYDNAQECHYFNDLWILSHLDSAGKWTAVQTAAHGDSPHPRSGHSMAVYNDTLFVYGGYSAEKFNRFKKSEATVHHDLWTIKLPNTEETAQTNAQKDISIWTKIRLGGIPPPIRSGVSCAARDKKMYLFGGVVDIESPGGKMVSSFNNDLFIFHMDTQRFYPVVLRKAAEPRGKDAHNNAERNCGGDLEAELKALQLENKSQTHAKNAAGDENDNDDEDTEDDDDDDDEEEEEVINVGENQEMRESYEINRRGQIIPHRRMDAALLVTGNTLYVFGGQFESGSKEITMSDLFSLNLNACDTFRVLLKHDLSTAVWLGNEAESDAGSWESGSTVVSNAFDFDMNEYDEEEEEEEADCDNGNATKCVKIDKSQEDVVEDGEEAPDAIPAELLMDVTPPLTAIDAVTTLRGRKGLQAHKERLFAQLSAGAAVPTPSRDEQNDAFFERTKSFWLKMARDSFDDTGATGKRRSDRRIEREASRFAVRRYNEARALLEQLRLVEEREKAEAQFFRERQKQKEREWEEYERQLAAQQSEDSDGDNKEEEEDKEEKEK